MNLYKHQIDFIKSNPNKTSLVWSCGTGKSRAAIEWAKRNRGTVLIVCPKSLKTNWKRECAKWGLEYAEVITKEEFRKSHLNMMKFDQIIVDEVHNGFLTPHFKSLMSKSLRWYLQKHKVSRVLLLSATVYSSSPWNIYNLALLTGHKFNYVGFDRMFFNHVRMGMRFIPVVKPGIDTLLAKITRGIASVVDIYDCMDVPEQLHLEPEYFSLNRPQRDAINDNYDPLPIVRYTLQHEIENGILIGNEFRASSEYPSDKMERIVALCEENQKIAIVCRYNAQIDAITTALSKNGIIPMIIRGDVKDRDAITQKAEKDDKAIVLIQADCAEGYQLPSFPICVFASQSYSYVKWEQICGRFLRMDKPTRTTFMYLVTEGDSVDQGVYNAVKRKEDFKIELYENN